MLYDKQTLIERINPELGLKAAGTSEPSSRPVFLECDLFVCEAHLVDVIDVWVVASEQQRQGASLVSIESTVSV